MNPSGIMALESAVGLLGGQSATARLIGVSQQSIWAALNTRKRVPAEWCLPIERATGGQVTRHQLRPDLYPDDRKDAADAAQ